MMQNEDIILTPSQVSQIIAKPRICQKMRENAFTQQQKVIEQLDQVGITLQSARRGGFQKVQSKNLLDLHK
jgi:hypothetical protein